MSGRTKSLIATVLALLSLAPGARANWSGSYVTPFQYDAQFTLVPDFDQRRDDIMNDGRMFCAPTAAVNWMAYIARHGVPFLEPGSQPRTFWHSTQAYDDVTGLLLRMGAFMQTNAIDGTGGSGFYDGVRQWLEESGAHFLFTLHYAWLDENWNTPRFDGLAQWVNQGVPVVGTVGWYDEDGFTLTRDGGHLFSVVGVQREGNQRLLTIHDPADDRALSDQSAPTPVTYAIEPRARAVMGLPRVVDKVLDYGSGYIDAYLAIRPIMGLAVSADRAQLVIVRPVRLSFDSGPELDTIAGPVTAPILDLVGDPGSAGTYLVTGVTRTSPSRLWRFDPVSRGFTEVAPLGEGTAVETDRFGRIYVLDGRTIRCFEIDDEERAVETGSVVPPLPCDALAIDDFNDRLVALCDGSVMPFSLRSLGALPAVPLPAGVTVDGVASLAISPRDGALFVTSEQSPAVYRLDGAGGYRAIGEGLLVRPRHLSVGDGDLVHVVDGASGLTKAFRRAPATGDWVEAPESPFAGLALGPGLRIARSRSNFDPVAHGGPAYRNVLPPDATTDVGRLDLPGAVPAIAAVSPNPFNPQTTIRLELPRDETVTLAVHDLRGGLVRTIWDGRLAAGDHALAWDGRDARGAAAPSGAYLLRLTTASGQRQSVKITLAK